MDLLISAQTSDSFEELAHNFEVEKIIKILRCEKNDDLKIRICDRVCGLLYQDSSFGLLKQVGNANRVILEYCRELCKIWIDRIDDCEFYTKYHLKQKSKDYCIPTLIDIFVFPPADKKCKHFETKNICVKKRQILSDYNEKGSKTTDKNNFPVKNSNNDWLAGKEISYFALERIFSIWLIICDLLSIDGVKEIRLFEKCYSSRLEFCQKLLNNDERCLTTTVLLLPYHEKLGKMSMFYAPLIVFSIFGLIEFDTEVIIDWLGSELVAISMFLRTLKMIGKNINDWKRLDGEESFSLPTPSITSESSPKLNLKIIEIIGNTNSAPKLIEISRKIHATLPNSRCYINYSTCFTTFQTMLSNLAEKLEKLQKRHLVPENYTTLINHCRRVARL